MRVTCTLAREKIGFSLIHSRPPRSSRINASLRKRSPDPDLKPQLLPVDRDLRGPGHCHCHLGPHPPSLDHDQHQGQLLSPQGKGQSRTHPRARRRGKSMRRGVIFRFLQRVNFACLLTPLLTPLIVTVRFAKSKSLSLSSADSRLRNPRNKTRLNNRPSRLDRAAILKNAASSLSLRNRVRPFIALPTGRPLNRFIRYHLLSHRGGLTGVQDSG